MVLVPMGSHTLAARVLAPSRGSLFTYAAECTHTAPGQPSLETAIREYRADRIKPHTRVYGIVGNKAGHSISPAMHNAAFAACGFPGVYLPFPVESLEDFLGVIGPLDIRGFSVTIPYKQAILPYLAGCDVLAHRLGAVNTVVVRHGKLYGYNTDYAGVLAALHSRVKLGGCRALILGAGGAARAAAFALTDAGSRVAICSRRMEQATELARAAGAQTIARSELRRRSFDLIVNSTPAGMSPDRSSPLAGAELRAPVVFDMVYRPLETPLLRQAASHGLKTISGLEMLVAQGVAQWELWTRKHAPAGRMRRAALEALRRAETEG
jgi:3-dehydroquinate dehydratase/shikimate dehydrogenase